MEKLFTLEELVEEYATEAQKESLKKYGNLNKRSLDSIMKRVDQDWESVNVEGRGSKRKFKCSGKRKIKAMKKDGRIRSGRQQIEHRIPMDIIVAAHLQNDVMKQASMSLGKWAVKFGIITELELDLIRSRHSNTLRQKHINLAIENDILEEDQSKLIEDFTLYSLEIYGQLAKTLEHMNKCGIISFYENWIGYSKDGKVSINPELMKEILKARRELMNKHNVVEFNLTAHRNAKKVKNFLIEWKQALADIEDEFGNVLGIKYYWKEYVVILKSSTEAVQRYLEMYCTEELEAYVNNKDRFLVQNKSNYVLKRKDNFLKKTEKFHKKKLKEYKEMKIGFLTAEDEELIRYFYTHQELEDIIVGYDLAVKRLHLQLLYTERMGLLFDLYKQELYSNKRIVGVS